MGYFPDLAGRIQSLDAFTLPPFSLIRDFGKQNTRGNVLLTYRIEIHQSQPASMR